MSEFVRIIKKAELKALLIHQLINGSIITLKIMINATTSIAILIHVFFPDTGELPLFFPFCAIFITS
jgi:hypothetical protein